MTDQTLLARQVFEAVMGRFSGGAEIEEIVAAMEREGAWDDEAWLKSVVDRAKKEDVRRFARTRDDDGRPLAESLTTSDGRIYKQEQFFNADDYAQRAAFCEQQRIHFTKERDHYLIGGARRYGEDVKAKYKQLLLPVGV